MRTLEHEFSERLVGNGMGYTSDTGDPNEPSDMLVVLHIPAPCSEIEKRAIKGGEGGDEGGGVCVATITALPMQNKASGYAYSTNAICVTYTMLLVLCKSMICI